MADDTGLVTDNREASRFELPVDGRTAILDYARRGNRVVLLHTEVPTELRGRGIGTRLVRGALDLMRAAGERADARCGFVKAFIASHPEYADLASGAPAAPGAPGASAA